MNTEINEIRQRVLKLTNAYEASAPSGEVSALFVSVAANLGHLSDNVAYLTNPSAVSQLTAADITFYNQETQTLLQKIADALGRIESKLNYTS